MVGLGLCRFSAFPNIEPLVQVSPCEEPKIQNRHMKYAGVRLEWGAWILLGLWKNFPAPNLWGSVGHCQNSRGHCKLLDSLRCFLKLIIVMHEFLGTSSTLNSFTPLCPWVCYKDETTSYPGWLSFNALNIPHLFLLWAFALVKSVQSLPKIPFLLIFSWFASFSSFKSLNK